MKLEILQENFFWIQLNTHWIFKLIQMKRLELNEQIMLFVLS